MTDLRKSFDTLMKKWGTDIYLRRQIGESKTFQYTTPVYAQKFEKHTTRYRLPGRATALAFAMEEKMEGQIRKLDRIYYFRFDVHPGQGDLIYQPDERYPTGYEIYAVDYAQPLRGKGGRIEYYSAGTTRWDPN